ncbi:MAG: hypothetical protein APF80_03165 [Alphaproteobacteria bacterium BRH_c36]|nr:MAG: hypothetical protein APF80_03165 [Alphaproteobacteria bacterium BRH_c36]
MTDSDNTDDDKDTPDVDDDQAVSRPAGLPEMPDPRLLELLVCPLTKTRLTLDRERGELISKAAGLAYPIRNGVPLMTIDAARHIDEQ